jgi:hypothetical protein
VEANEEKPDDTSDYHGSLNCRRPRSTVLLVDGRHRRRIMLVCLRCFFVYIPRGAHGKARYYG